jgi:phospholipase/carboxylesterase
VRSLELGGLTVHLAGGADRDGGGDGPLVVLLHGFGAPGTDLVPLWRQLVVPRGTRFAFPEAPIALDGGSDLDFSPGGSRAWWHIDLERLQAAPARGARRDLSAEVPVGLAGARASVVAMLDELEKTAAASPLVLGGFSQGAMLACDVALRTGRPLAGLVLLSTTYLCADEWRPLFQRRRGLPVLQSHGRDDPLLPFDLAELLRDELAAAGLDVSFVPFSGGHGIADPVMDALGRFVTRVTEASTAPAPPLR